MSFIRYLENDNNNNIPKCIKLGELCNQKDCRILETCTTSETNLISRSSELSHRRESFGTREFYSVGTVEAEAIETQEES